MSSTFKSGWLAQFCSIVSLYLMYASAQEMFGQKGLIGGRWQIAASELVAAIIFAGAAFWLKGRSMRAGDARRTAFAETYFFDAIENLANGETSTFTLYLRPFKLTNQLNFRTPEANFFIRDLLIEEQKDIERLIAEAVEATAPLIGLGRPGEHFGAGRIDISDEHWRDAVTVLAHAAERIVLIPYPAGGTLWEVEHVFTASLLDKVVFVMPPSVEHQVDIKNYWESCEEIVRSQLGAAFPPWVSDGALFSMEASGRTGAVIRPPLTSPKHLRNAIEQLAKASARTLPAELLTSARRLHEQFQTELEHRSTTETKSRAPPTWELLPSSTRDLSHHPEFATTAAALSICLALTSSTPAILPRCGASNVPLEFEFEPKSDPDPA